MIIDLCSPPKLQVPIPDADQKRWMNNINNDFKLLELKKNSLPHYLMWKRAILKTYSRWSSTFHNRGKVALNQANYVNIIVSMWC